MSKIRLITIIGVLVFQLASFAQVPPVVNYDETDIRILLVADISVTSNEVSDAKAYLELVWQNSFLNVGLNSTTLTFANGGTPIPTSGLLTGAIVGSSGQVRKLKDFVELIDPTTMSSRRDDFGADIVLGLAKASTDVCGLAPQEYWFGVDAPFLRPEFDNTNPDTNFLDLRGRNDSYIGVAVVSSTQTNCGAWVLAHETGHLFGSGHYNLGTTLGINNLSLTPESRATYKSIGHWGFELLRYVTAMANVPGVNDACDPFGVAPWPACLRESFFSWGLYGSNLPTSNFNNEASTRLTARSVANYRVGTGIETPVAMAMCSDGIDNDGDALIDGADSDCAVCDAEFCPPPPSPPPPACSGTQAPTNFVKQIIGCVPPEQLPGTHTEYIVSWSHICPGSVNYYKIWVENPIGTTPIHKWDVGGRSTWVAVDGIGIARIRAQSCNSLGVCGSISTEGANLVDTC